MENLRDLFTARAALALEMENATRQGVTPSLHTRRQYAVLSRALQRQADASQAAWPRPTGAASHETPAEGWAGGPACRPCAGGGGT